VGRRGVNWKPEELAQLQGAQPETKSKYRSRKKEVDGILFDSKREAAAYVKLRAMEQAGEIRDLRRQVKFVLLDGFRTDDGEKVREMAYFADFVFTGKDGAERVVDVKGMRTEVYRLKRKLFLARYPHLRLEEW
jgi:hypothetical protein